LERLASRRPSTARDGAPRSKLGIDGLWAEFKETGSPALRNDLIVHYAPFVKYVAGRLSESLPRHFDEDDLAGYGVIGLIDALERFNPARDFRFETYALPRIKGAIIDELRSVDWVPRSVRTKRRAVEQAVSHLESILHRTPSRAELACELGLSVDDLNKVLFNISKVGILTLDEAPPGDGPERPTLGEALADPNRGPTDVLEAKESHAVLARAVDGLADRERRVLLLYYYEELTLREIGEILGVTESRACQIHTKALRQLHSKLVDRPERTLREAVVAWIEPRRAEAGPSEQPQPSEEPVPQLLAS
jgi:RNA polymerase sigma factor for flagellar operon FliA